MFENLTRSWKILLGRQTVLRFGPPNSDEFGKHHVACLMIGQCGCHRNGNIPSGCRIGRAVATLLEGLHPLHVSIVHCGRGLCGIDPRFVQSAIGVKDVPAHAAAVVLVRYELEMFCQPQFRSLVGDCVG